MTHQEALEKAELFQKEASKQAEKRYWKPKYHITAPANWINDPNGFCYFDGEYHLFYQYHPYSAEWGPMHWGHASSSDLVEWRTRPIALAPTDEYDKGGCFSGSAIEKDGKLYAMYTGHVDLDKSLGGNDRIESQCIAISEDGDTFKKVENNPVIKKVPENIGIRTEHFRDPKVWKHGDLYYVVVGVQTLEESGAVVVYKSKDLINWEFLNIMAKSTVEENLGFMWECPNFGEADGRDILIVSPQGMKPEAEKYLNVHQSGFFLGKMNYETGEFDRQTAFDIFDYGFDFYAPQIMQDEKNNRCIMISWLDMWESKMPEQKDGWCGMMSIPRVLKVKDNTVYSLPAPELVKLRKSEVHHEVTTDKTVSFDDVAGDCYELNAVFDLTEANGVNLKLRVSENEETDIAYDKETNILLLDRDKSGSGIEGQRQVEVAPIDNKLSLRIFSDRSSLEIFINDGQRVLSSRVYPTEEATGIVFVPNGLMNISIDFYKI